MADGFAPERYGLRRYNLLLVAAFYRLNHRGDTVHNKASHTLMCTVR